MSDHLSLDRLTQYRDGALPSDELLDVDDHLASCPACRDLAQTLSGPAGRLDATLAAAAPHDHVDFDALTQYVDGTLNGADREIVEAHLVGCALCAEDLGDLRRARAEVLALLPEATPGMASWLARLLGGRAVRVGAAAVAVVALVWAVRPNSSDAPVATVPPSTETPLPRVMASLRDGQFTVTVDERGAVTGLPELRDADRAAVSTALTAGRLEVAGVAGLRGTTGVLMGETGSTSTSLTVTAPVATAVESDRPRFAWTAMPGALGYVVTVYDHQFNEVARSPEIRAVTWTSSTKFRRGATYAWQVTVRTATGTVSAPTAPAPEARFRVVEADAAAGLERARRTYADSRLVLAVLYAGAGLVDAADAELARLQQENAGSTVIASLRASLREPTRRAVPD